MGRRSQIPELEAKLGMPVDKYLREAIKQGKQQEEIAAALGITLSTFYQWINKFGLKALLKEAAQTAIYARKSGELKEAIDEFLRDKERVEVSPKTLANYRDSLYKFLWWMEVEAKKPSTLGTFENPQTIKDFLYYLKNTKVRWGGKSATGRKAAGSSTNNLYRQHLGTFGAWAKFNDKTKTNPIEKVARTRIGHRDPPDLPDDVIQRMFDSFDGSFRGRRNATISLMFLDTGLRLGGVSELDENSFDLDTGFGRVIEKGNKQRLIHLSTNMLIQLKAYLAVREPVAKTKKLWINERGEHFDSQDIQSMYNGLKHSIDTRIHPHIFRHVWAKKMAEAKVDMYALKAMGGWEDFELVMHYAAAYTPQMAWEVHDRVTPITIFLKGASNG